MPYIHRKIEPRIIKAAKTMPVIGIVGPRQSGKTTLVKNLFPGFLYVNLEFPDDRAFAERDPRAFLLQKNEMIIDEIQQVPELFSFIQGFVDEDKNRKYVVTGSNNFSLLEKISQSLAGRIAMFTILPFSLSELSKNTFISSNDAQFFGFYPRVVVEHNNPVEWYQGYIQTYLERDVRQITVVHKFEQFYQFLKMLAAKSSSVVNFAEFANETGVAVNTIRGWFSVLLASYIIYTLPPYFSHIAKRLAKSPRFYFYDTGLLCALLGIRSANALNSHILTGQIFENFIISELIKNEYINHHAHTLFYYRDHDGLEVDVVREKENGLDLFEIKRSSIYKPGFAENMQTLEKLLPNTLTKNIIYGGKQTMDDKGCHVIGWKDI